MKSKLLKIFKIALGSTIAIAFAYLLDLEYALSAGIIALLTIQDTKKATLELALKRIIAFAINCIAVYLIFSIFGYTVIAFGIYLLLFASYCIFAGVQVALSINAVLATHFLLSKSMGLDMIVNEALLLLIGSGIGILMNLYIPNNVKQIREKQKDIEECMKSVLSNLADQIELTEATEETKECKANLREHIKAGIDYAYTNMNNTFFQESEYFIKYMQMRKQQRQILDGMFEKVERLTMVTEQSKIISNFIRETEQTLAESNNAERLLEEDDRLISRCQNGILPKSREEFETRAVLYVILMDFREFLLIKKEFSDALSRADKIRYWEKNYEN